MTVRHAIIDKIDPIKMLYHSTHGVDQIVLAAVTSMVEAQIDMICDSEECVNYTREEIAESVTQALACTHTLVADSLEAFRTSVINRLNEVILNIDVHTIQFENNRIKDIDVTASLTDRPTT